MPEETDDCLTSRRTFRGVGTRMLTRTLMVSVCFSVASTGLHADVLATFDRPLTAGISGDIPATALDIDVYYLDSRFFRIQTSVIFDDLFARPLEVGSVYTADSTNDKNFANFVDLLTNGTEETLGTSGGLWTDTDGFRVFNAASILLLEASDAGFAGNPLSLNGIDLWGYDIEEVQLRLNDLSLDHDGATNSFSFDVTVSILGNRKLPTGDADGNGIVEFTDFLILARNFDSPGRWVNGDFDLNGQVDFSDFLVLNANFGERRQTAATITSIPEPATFTMLAGVILIGACWWRRRRSGTGKGGN